MRPVATLLACFALLAGCSGDAGTASIAESETAETPQPASEPTPTQEPTTAPTPEPEAELRRGEMTVVAWNSEFMNRPQYQVFIQIINDGDGWAEIVPGSADYTILDASGGLVTTGFFIYAYPELLGPGETGYLAADGSGDEGQSPDDFATVEAEGDFNPIAAPDVTFEFADVQWRPDEFIGGLTAAGFLTATADVGDASVGAFCMGADGNPLGYSSTNLVQNITAGERKGFETVTSTPPLTADQCVETLLFASDTGF